MFCKHCGFKLDDDAKFCPSCGKKVDAKKDGSKNVSQDSGYDISYDNHVNTKSINKIITIVIALCIVLGIAFFVFNVFMKNSGSIQSDVNDATENVKETIATDEYGRLYYADKDGKLKFNTWVTYNGHEYYVDDNGFVMKDAWIDNEYYVDSEGKKVINDWCQDKNSGVYYYLGTDGKYIRGTIQTIDSKKYYFFENGIMAKAQIVPDFKDNKKLMYASEDGSLVEKEGDYTIQGKKYHIGKDGYIVINTTTTQTTQPTQAVQPTQAAPAIVEHGTYDLASFYKKIETAKVATRINNYQNINSFDTVKFGHFEQDNNPNNGAEVVEWVVLEKNAQNQTALLWSKYILDNATLTGVKAWLNNFYISSFTNEDKLFVINHDYENYGFTNMSVLGPEELKRYYYYNEGLDKYYNYETLATQFAVVKGVAVNQAGFGAYWYDTSSKGEYLAPAGLTPSKDKVGVRPCIWVKYTGNVTEIAGSNQSGNSSSANTGGVLSIDTYQNIDDEFFWGDEETTVTYNAKMPVFKGGIEGELDQLSDGIEEMMETLLSFAEDYVSRSNVRVRKISFTKPTTKTLDAKNVVLEFSGTVTFSGASAQTVKYTFTYSREEGDYTITRTQ